MLDEMVRIRENMVFTQGTDIMAKDGNNIKSSEQWMPVVSQSTVASRKVASFCDWLQA